MLLSICLLKEEGEALGKIVRALYSCLIPLYLSEHSDGLRVRMEKEESARGGLVKM